MSGMKTRATKLAVSNRDQVGGFGDSSPGSKSAVRKRKASSKAPQGELSEPKLGKIEKVRSIAHTKHDDTLIVR